jgi:hypothetical protein
LLIDGLNKLLLLSLFYLDFNGFGPLIVWGVDLHCVFRMPSDIDISRAKGTTICFGANNSPQKGRSPIIACDQQWIT